MPGALDEQAAFAELLRRDPQGTIAPAPGAAQEMQNVRRAVAKQENRNPSVLENMQHRLIGVDDPIGFQQGKRGAASARRGEPSIFDLRPEDLRNL